MQSMPETITGVLDSSKAASSLENNAQEVSSTSNSPPQARKASPSLQRTKSFNSKSKASSPSTGSTFGIKVPPPPKRRKTVTQSETEKTEGRKSKYFDSRKLSLAFDEPISTRPTASTSTQAITPRTNNDAGEIFERSTRRSSRLSKKEEAIERREDYSSEKEIVLATPARPQTQTKSVKKRRVRPKTTQVVTPALPPSLPAPQPSTSSAQETNEKVHNDGPARVENFSRSPCPSPTLIEPKVEVTDEAVPSPSLIRQATVSRSCQAKFDLDDGSASTVASSSQIHASSSRFESINRSGSVNTASSPPVTATTFSIATTPAPNSLAADLLSVAPEFYLTSNPFLQLDFLAPLLLSLRLRSFSALRDLPACILRSYLDHAQTNYESRGSLQGIIKTEDWNRMKDLLCNVLIEREGTSKKFFDTVLC
ncbi:hypothetical protein JCM3765_000662 [Sporobolomyces pararoseus]